MGSSDAVVVSGATGLVGARLSAELLRRGGSVRALSRDGVRAVSRLPAGATAFDWDGVHPPAETLADATAVVHLAGEPVFAGRLSDARRRRIRDSRLDSTRALVRGIADLPAAARPGVLVCASAVGYYGDRGDEVLDEGSPPGEGFLAELCRAWEDRAKAAEEYGVRVVRLRIGIVLSRDGGALPRMAVPFRLGAGGRLGDGRQWFPWVHLDDVVGMIRWSLEEAEVAGALNVTAPAPVRNAELTRALARQLRRPARFPVPAFALRAALGELAGELLGSRRVQPAAARAGGYSFAEPELATALSRELG